MPAGGGGGDGSCCVGADDIGRILVADDVDVPDGITLTMTMMIMADCLGEGDGDEEDGDGDAGVLMRYLYPRDPKMVDLVMLLMWRGRSALGPNAGGAMWRCKKFHHF